MGVFLDHLSFCYFLKKDASTEFVNYSHRHGSQSTQVGKAKWKTIRSHFLLKNMYPKNTTMLMENVDYKTDSLPISASSQKFTSCSSGSKNVFVVVLAFGFFYFSGSTMET